MKYQIAIESVDGQGHQELVSLQEIEVKIDWEHYLSRLIERIIIVLKGWF